MNPTLTILSILGFILSCYAFYVEWKTHTTKKYRAVCDINDHMSCSAAFTSSYGKLLGIPNSILGILCYITLVLLLFLNLTTLFFYVTLLSCIASAGLAYILYFKMKNFCIVCSSIYLVNILLLIISYQAL